MRIGFTFKVRFIDPVSGLEVHAPCIQQDIKLTDDTLAAYLDEDIADTGVVGGEVYLKRSTREEAAIEVTYWYPGMPDNQSIDSLRTYTVSQLEDGIGEGGFEVDLDGWRL